MALVCPVNFKLNDHDNYKANKPLKSTKCFLIIQEVVGESFTVVFIKMHKRFVQFYSTEYALH
ncbi:MAG: hypothetical protein Kow00117_13850 [Phototrophicales bacterium]